MSDQSSEAYNPSSSHSSHASDTSEHRSVGESDNNEGLEKQQTSRKRKVSADAEDEQPAKKTSLRYVAAYLELYNQTVKDIVEPWTLNQDHWRWRDGRIGLSWWTAHEKQVFFATLDRVGSLNVRAISRAIGSKSEPEVQSFILDLQQGYADVHQRHGGSSLLDYSDHLASVEVSAECEAALEAAADSIANRQAKVDAIIEKARHGEHWLLSAETLENIDISSDTQMANSTLESAASVLNLSRMMMLSSKLFMNSANEDDDWRSYTQDDSGPSIYATAFVDMYNLLVGITKRVVSSAIFLAESRHEHQVMPGKRKPKPVIRSLDVQSACEMLGLGESSRNYWASVPRRCKLQVLGDDDKPITYKKVEELLGTESVNPDDEDDDSVSEGDDPIDISALALTHDGQYFVDEEEDKRAERLDTAQNQAEEARLWRILEQEGRSQGTIKTEDHEMTLPPRRPEEPTKLWQAGLSYKAQWQLVNGPPSKEQFRTRRKERIQSVDSRSSSGIPESVDYSAMQIERSMSQPEQQNFESSELDYDTDSDA